MSDYISNIVKKPWGYEYLTYQNDFVALWLLHIKYTHSTSLHCHSKKTTGLFVISGEVEVSFFNNTSRLGPGDKIMIRKGLFHSTKAISEKGAYVLEIETPVDKHDLIRFRDSYGREGKPYEDESFETPKPEDYIWIEDPSKGKAHHIPFRDSILHVVSIPDINIFKNTGDTPNVIFLRGGIQASYGGYVAGPGDIVSLNTIQQLIEVFDKLDPNTITLTVNAFPTWI